MKINLSKKVLSAYLEKFPDPVESERIENYYGERMIDFEITTLEQNQIDYIRTLIEKQPDICKFPGSNSTLKRLTSFSNIRKDPGGKVVKRLEDMAQAMVLYIQEKSPNQWLFTESSTGFLLPRLVTNIQYFPYAENNPAHVRMSTKWLVRGHEQSYSYNWGNFELLEGKTVAQLLQSSNLFLPTEALMKAYKASMAKYTALQPMTGEQFTGEGSANIIEGKWGRSETALIRDGIKTKLVMDDIHPEGNEFGTSDGTEKTTFWHKGSKELAEKVALPVHPYVKVFDLDKHEFLEVNSDQLEVYKWNPSLADKLILPEDHKEIVQILMDTAQEEIDDIISGKSGGTIIIATGDPGTGKTLTAEVTSEVIQRPLYKVQCSQVGTDEETIEKKLGLVLARAARWKALLLIDEADVYIRARGEDIQQNAIVGVFLRVLEYYRGVLFMTSNRATVIDDAIMSRATVHLKYLHPTVEAIGNIWRVLATQFGLGFKAQAIEQLVKTFPKVTGRDIKAILKLGIRYSRKSGNLTLPMMIKLAAHKDIQVDQEYADAIQTVNFLK